MDQQFTPDTGRSLEEVQQRFERWREERKRGTPIPAALWEDAVHLCTDHSLCKISRVLHLGYKALKKRLQSACPDHFPGSVMSSDYSLDLGNVPAEFLHGFGKPHPVHEFYEADGVATRAAAEALPKIFPGVDGKRWGCLGVEGAKPHVPFAVLLQLNGR